MRKPNADTEYDRLTLATAGQLLVLLEPLPRSVQLRALGTAAAWAGANASAATLIASARETGLLEEEYPAKREPVARKPKAGRTTVPRPRKGSEK